MSDIAALLNLMKVKLLQELTSSEVPQLMSQTKGLTAAAIAAKISGH